MYRNLSLLIAISAATASTAAFPVANVAAAPARSSGHASRPADNKSGTANYVLVKDRHRSVVAMAPTEAEVGDWRVKVTRAKASPVAETVSQPQEDEPVSKLSIFGMLAAALGLGGMSIVRRMGRL
jgi:hypothetical protein